MIDSWRRSGVRDSGVAAVGFAFSIPLPATFTLYPAGAPALRQRGRGRPSLAGGWCVLVPVG